MILHRVRERRRDLDAPARDRDAGDRGLFTAPAISPNGTDVYVVYNAFTTPFRDNTTDPRTLVGVVLHADRRARRRRPERSREIHRGAPGDPRGSSANALTDEFLGDYVYATATPRLTARRCGTTRATQRTARHRRLAGSAADRESGRPRPAPQQDCPAQLRQLRHLQLHNRVSRHQPAPVPEHPRLTT